MSIINLILIASHSAEDILSLRRLVFFVSNCYVMTKLLKSDCRFLSPNV